jgi:Flp pilus assembly pilin Flp
MRDAQRGAAIVEHVLLIGLLMVTFIGVLTLYTLAIKQVACERIFATTTEGFTFNPYGAQSLNWFPIGDATGCYYIDGGGLNRVF